MTQFFSRFFEKHIAKTNSNFSYADAKRQIFIVKNLLNHWQKTSTCLTSSAIPYLNTKFF